jgi:hypothetical protein
LAEAELQVLAVLEQLVAIQYFHLLLQLVVDLEDTTQETAETADQVVELVDMVQVPAVLLQAAVILVVQ